MQQQIRPHFSIVYTLAELGWTREAKKATMALASFYMRSMSGERDHHGTRRERNDSQLLVYPTSALQK